MPVVDILIYVEDPGAANYVSRFPAAFMGQGSTVGLLADGFAYAYLTDRGVSVIHLSAPITARQVLSEWKPKLMIVGTSENPDTFGFDLIIAARQVGVTTVGVIDAFGNADYRFRGNTGDSLRYAPDWLMVPDPWTQMAYVRLGYPKARVVPCGHPHCDEVMDTKVLLEREGRSNIMMKVFPGCPDESPVVVFVSEVSTGLNMKQYQWSSEYTLTGNGDRTDRTGIVLEEFLGAMELLARRPYLVLRMHPKNTEDELKLFLNEFDQVSQQGGPLEMVFAADLVVGMTTMLLQEAAIMGTPTLSIVPRIAETSSLPTVRAGITPCVTTRKELRDILPGMVTRRQSDSTADNNTKNLFPYGSLEKIQRFIYGILGNENSEDKRWQNRG